MAATSPIRKAVREGILGALFLGAVLLLLGGDPVRTALAAGVWALAMAIGVHRHARGKPFYPMSVMAIIGGVGLAVASYAFLVVDPARGRQWIPVIAVLAFMAAPLVLALLHWHRRPTAGSEADE